MANQTQLEMGTDLAVFAQRWTVFHKATLFSAKCRSDQYQTRLYSAIMVLEKSHRSHLHSSHLLPSGYHTPKL